MSAAGFVTNYVNARNTLYDDVERRKVLFNKHVAGPQTNKSEIELILDDIAELKLVVAAILDLLIEKGALAHDDLVARADELDVLDGVRDGKLHAQVQPDGTITPDTPAPKTALDELADAAKDAEEHQA